MPYADHKIAAGTRSVACGIITCSDTRTVEEDESGRIIRELLQDGGHTHPFYSICKDDPATIRSLMGDWCARPEIQAIILNGGTGIARRDNTFDVVSAMLTKTLPGFGELFRMLSYQTIGSGGAAFPRDGRHHRVSPPTGNSRPPHDCFLHSRFPQCGGTGDDEAHPAGALAPCVGDDSLAFRAYSSSFPPAQQPHRTQCQ